MTRIRLWTDDELALFFKLQRLLLQKDLSDFLTVANADLEADLEKVCCTLCASDPPVIWKGELQSFGELFQTNKLNEGAWYPTVFESTEHANKEVSKSLLASLDQFVSTLSHGVTQ